MHTPSRRRSRRGPPRHRLRPSAPHTHTAHTLRAAGRPGGAVHTPARCLPAGLGSSQRHLKREVNFSARARLWVCFSGVVLRKCAQMGHCTPVGGKRRPSAVPGPPQRPLCNGRLCGPCATAASAVASPETGGRRRDLGPPPTAVHGFFRPAASRHRLLAAAGYTRPPAQRRDGAPSLRTGLLQHAPQPHNTLRPHNAKPHTQRGFVPVEAPQTPAGRQTAARGVYAGMRPRVAAIGGRRMGPWAPQRTAARHPCL